MGNGRQGRGGGRGREDVNGIFDSCFFMYCSLLGDFCSENIIFKKNCQVSHCQMRIAKKS